MYIYVSKIDRPQKRIKVDKIENVQFIQSDHHEKFEDAERVISSVNGRMTDNTMAKREKWQNDKVLQVTTQNIKDRLTRTLLKTWG